MRQKHTHTCARTLTLSRRLYHQIREGSDSPALRGQQTGRYLQQHLQKTKSADTERQTPRRSKQGRGIHRILFGDTNQGVKLAADETKSSLGEEEEEASLKQAEDGGDRPAGRESPGKMVRAELEWDIPMLVTLPVQVQLDAAHQPFPFLDTKLADLGIQE